MFQTFITPPYRGRVAVEKECRAAMMMMLSRDTAAAVPEDERYVDDGARRVI